MRGRGEMLLPIRPLFGKKPHVKTNELGPLGGGVRGQPMPKSSSRDLRFNLTMQRGKPEQ